MVSMLRVAFVRGETRRYRSVIHRADGVAVSFEGGSYNKIGGPVRDVPHDFAHLVVEDELGLRSGVWGVLAAGGLFRHATVVEGRQKPHAARRGAEIVRAAHAEVMRAEGLVRAVCDACDGRLALRPDAIRRAVGGEAWTEAVTPAALSAARARLRGGAERWWQLAPGEALEEGWRLPTPR